MQNSWKRKNRKNKSYHLEIGEDGGKKGGNEERRIGER